MISLAAPALPLHTAGKYVAAAYVVFVALLLVYLAIVAIRLQRTERDLVELNAELSKPDSVGRAAGAGRPGPELREEELV